MNSKIGSGEVMVIVVAIVFSLFPDFVILTTSKNASLLSLIIGFIIGLIPVMMIYLISKKIDTSFFSFLKDRFKSFGYVINIILILLAIFIVFFSSWMHFDFIISQFLIRDSYYFMAILFAILAIIAIVKGPEVISRTSFILFLIAVPILLVLLGALIPYVELDNLKPYIDTSFYNILTSSIIFFTLSTAPLIYILDIKNITNDKSNFARKILVGYIIGFLIIFLMVLFVLAVYGVDLASMFTYPFYSLFKKVQIFGFIERIENIAAIIFITSFFVEFTYLLYFIKNNISEMFKIKSKKKALLLTSLLSILIPFISIYLFKKFNLAKYLGYTHYIVGIIFIIIIIMFIRCLFIKKR